MNRYEPKTTEFSPQQVDGQWYVPLEQVVALLFADGQRGSLDAIDMKHMLVYATEMEDWTLRATDGEPEMVHVTGWVVSVDGYVEHPDWSERDVDTLDHDGWGRASAWVEENHRITIAQQEYQRHLQEQEEDRAKNPRSRLASSMTPVDPAVVIAEQAARHKARRKPQKRTPPVGEDNCCCRAGLLRVCRDCSFNACHKCVQVTSS